MNLKYYILIAVFAFLSISACSADPDDEYFIINPNISYNDSLNMTFLDNDTIYNFTGPSNDSNITYPPFVPGNDTNVTYPPNDTNITVPPTNPGNNGQGNIGVGQGTNNGVGQGSNSTGSGNNGVGQGNNNGVAQSNIAPGQAKKLL